MAFVQCQFFSNALEIAVTVNVILPEQIKGPLSTMYLLHGLSDDHSMWTRRTSVERYAADLQLAIVMPAVNRSFYADMVHGAKYWTFVSEELPARMRAMFPLSSAREHNFAAGLSMGGYGAMKLGLSHPDRYAAVASLSGAMDVDWLATGSPSDFAKIFGDVDSVKGTGHDLFALADRVAAGGNSPLLYQCCGTEDFLYECNVGFREHARSLSLPLTYEEGPGEHEWGYWDTHIKRVLDWIPLQGR
ncbi:alpha/beta hydrolase [Cohnella sp. GCM10027633]|uniref:alpha/beta hydrolase n=1 Tax=unclassified Cohnella TaxID=2636738 RepID=UPI00362D7548